MVNNLLTNWHRAAVLARHSERASPVRPPVSLRGPFITMHCLNLSGADGINPSVGITSPS